MAFSENLKMLMDTRQMKAADLARATGLSEAAISDYLKGKKEPRGRQSISIARAINVSLDELWETDFADPKKSPDSEEPETEDFDEEEFQLFCKAMVTLGYLREGEDFTDTQVQVLAGIIQILDATFPRFADGQLDEARTAG